VAILMPRHITRDVHSAAGGPPERRAERSGGMKYADRSSAVTGHGFMR